MKAFTSIVAVSAAAVLLVACGQKAAEPDRTEGPVVSAPEAPGNAAVDTTPTTGDAAQTAGASSFTESQARGAIENAGYSAVGALTQNEQGVWSGKATKDGKEVTVSVDYKGAISSQ
jgi:putative membrane protein